MSTSLRSFTPTQFEVYYIQTCVEHHILVWCRECCLEKGSVERLYGGYGEVILMLQGGCEEVVLMSYGGCGEVILMLQGGCEEVVLML